MKAAARMAIVLAAVLAAQSTGAEFVGDWVNIDPKTDGILRVEITAAGHNYAVHVWSADSPEPRDWETKVVPPGKFLTAVYEFGLTTVTLTIAQISEVSLRVHTVSQPPIGNPVIRDDYLYPVGGPKPKPDLSITEMTVNKTLSVSGETTPVVTVTVRNNGPGILTGGTIIARVDSCIRSGLPVTLPGTDEFSYSGSIAPGQEVTQMLAMGPDLGMPAGHYVIRLRVDPDNTIAEYNENNNLSEELWFEVVYRNFLAGTVVFNHQPISNYTQGWPEQRFLMDSGSSIFIDDYGFWYMPETGQYLFSGLPDMGILISMRFRATEGEISLPGNFWVFQTVDVPALSDAAAGNFELPAELVMHLREPFDNLQTMTTIYDIPHHCLPMTIQWDPVPGATSYRVMIVRTRDFDHPDGYGQIETILDETLSGLQLYPTLPMTQPLEHYELFVRAFNASQEEIATVLITRGGGVSWQYLFKMCGRCSIADLSRDCQVTMPDLAILAEHWLEDWRNE